MSLDDYRRKRNFKRTPEPDHTDTEVGEVPVFVIHHHQSRRPHYDLRLEAEGVLKSWAIPKGPSLNPQEKHLAVRVEDHPFSYRNFEGNIPVGNYGSGTVMIWDEGYYHPITPGNVSENIEKGHFAFVLSGEKLKGEFALVKLRTGGADDWLLIKADDGFATKADIKRKNRSVRSGRTIEEIRGSGKEPEMLRIKPMLATLANEPFDDQNWLFEIKWDGFRALADIRGGEVDLYSRNLKSLKERFPTINANLAKLSGEMTLDGEIVALDEKGRPSFVSLADGSGDHIVYYVFDMLRDGSEDILNLPLEERRERLRERSRGWPVNIQYSEAIRGEGKDFYKAAKARDLEGIIAKKRGSLYHPGSRSSDWLKIKITKTLEAIIGGYTSGKDSRPFGSLILGLPSKAGLHYIGNVGTGFGERSMAEVMNRMEELKVANSPFYDLGLPTAFWVSPRLVAQIKYQEWTKEGHLRQPVFLGLREDKTPEEVQSEVADDR